MTVNLAIDHVGRIANELCKEPVREVISAGAGANSRIFCVRCENQKFALKFYRTKSVGGWSRQEAEAAALRFMERNGISTTPRLIANDKDNNCSLIEWFEGKPVNALGDDPMAAAADFLGKLHSLRSEPETADFALGTEACLSGSELTRQLDMRLERLQGGANEDPDFKKFLEEDFAPAIEEIGSWAQSVYTEAGFDFSMDISRDLQTLSPVDFGFHNMLQRDDDEIIFLDFEYFGWADPVNLISDILWHPGMDLSLDKKRMFAEKLFSVYGRGDDLLKRLRVFYPLYGLRWCAIMLNLFLPGYQMPGTENATAEEKHDKRAAQLQRVVDRLKDVYQGYEEFPYGS